MTTYMLHQYEQIRFRKQSIMNPVSDFESLDEGQQLQVLRFLEATGSEDIHEAISTLRRFNMDASEALNYRFNQPEREDSPGQNVLSREQEQQLARYNSHLREKYLEMTSLTYMVKSYLQVVRSFVRELSECIMPKCLSRSIFCSKFDRLYKGQSKITLYSRGLHEAMKKASHDEKCCAIIVSPQSKDSEIVQLLNCVPEVVKLMSTRIISLGTMSGSAEHRLLKTELEAPIVIFAYKTIFDQIKILTWVDVCDVTESRVREAISRFRNEKRKEKNITIRFNNRILTMYDQVEHLEEEIPESTNYEHQRLLIAQQKVDYEEAQKQAKVIQKQRKESIDKEEQEKLKVQQLLEERRARKMSIPEELQAGDVVLLNFRCPNGTKLCRKFERGQKVDILYSWVETNEQIQFQEEPQRGFQLLKGYPPLPLSGQKECLIRDVFEDQQELVLIKQL